MLLQKVEDEILSKHKIQLYVYRLDLIHPQISGNKWFKLKYNIAKAKKLGKRTLLSFGGAYSNHIYALASAGKHYQLATIGIIRGEEHLPLNNTLAYAKACGIIMGADPKIRFKTKDNPS